MSITLNLEIDCQLRRDELIRALKSCGTNAFVEEEFGFSGYFTRSNMHFACFERTRPYWAESGMRSCVIAEGVPRPLTWEICVRISFRYVLVSYEDCRDDLQKFMENLAQISKAYFVLSFQHEKVYAIRDENGLHILDKF